YPLVSISKPYSACSRVFAGDIYGDHALSCAGIIGIKHRYNVVRVALFDICYRSGISAGLDVCVDMTGSPPLTQTGMVDFVPGRVVIYATQHKRVKYMAQCVTIRYEFLPFSFSSMGELEEDAVTLLKRIRKILAGKEVDIGLREGRDKPLRPTDMAGWNSRLSALGVASYWICNEPHTTAAVWLDRHDMVTSSNNKKSQIDDPSLELMRRFSMLLRPLAFMYTYTVVLEEVKLTSSKNVLLDDFLLAENFPNSDSPMLTPKSNSVVTSLRSNNLSSFNLVSLDSKHRSPSSGGLSFAWTTPFNSMVQVIWRYQAPQWCSTWELRSRRNSTFLPGVAEVQCHLEIRISITTLLRRIPNLFIFHIKLASSYLDNQSIPIMTSKLPMSIPREDVAEDVESLSTKYPIVDWKTYTLTENFMYYQIFRGDGSSKNYKVLSEMLEDFDRQDVEELYRLVKERYSASRPEGYDLMLWGDLHTLFEPDEEDEIWKNQHEYNVISWSLYDFCGIHILLMQNGIAIHMLTEKKYPLSQEMISKMLKKKLEVDHESSQAFELLSTNGVSTASTYLVLPELVNTARRKINTADGQSC
ncbi:hypothetical protein Tco_0494878, partial [Tanacetum coccineum]